MEEEPPKIEAATQVHHLQRHYNRDLVAFICSPLVSLCARHHGVAEHIERHGYSNEIGPDGFPRDPNHPFYTGRLGSPGGPNHSK